MRNGLVSALCLVSAALLSLPAFADIKAFNAAVAKGDYKAAAAEAAATWPQLDMARDDINLIANEFGFAAYMAGNYAQGRDFARTAAATPASGTADPQLQTSATVLLRLCEHNLAPSSNTRTQLATALSQRTAFPGLDRVSFLGANTLVVHDIENGEWKDARASAALAIQLVKAGGAHYRLPMIRLGIYDAIAEYMETKSASAHVKLRALVDAAVAEIDAAPSDEDAAGAVKIFWEARGWALAIETSIGAKRLLKETGWDGVNRPKTEFSDRYRRLVFASDNDTCPRETKFKEPPNFPNSTRYRGFVGTVVAYVDIDAKGKAVNPRILAAIPETFFAKAAIESTRSLSYKQGKAWAPGCTLARKDQVVEFTFIIR